MCASGSTFYSMNGRSAAGTCMPVTVCLSLLGGTGGRPMCLWSVVCPREVSKERESFSLGSRPLSLPALRRCEMMARCGPVADSRRAEAGMYHPEGRAGQGPVFRVGLVRADGRWGGTTCIPPSCPLATHFPSSSGHGCFGVWAPWTDVCCCPLLYRPLVCMAWVCQRLHAMGCLLAA